MDDETKEAAQSLPSKERDAILSGEVKAQYFPPVTMTPAPDPQTAEARIRAFEDEHLGKDCVRIGGKIERGSGSPFAAMNAEKKRQYAALEKLVVAEQKLADAHAALIQAEADHQAAMAAAEPKPDAATVE